MRKSRFADEQIACALLVEQDTPAAALCRKLGVSEQNVYVWKKRFAGMGKAEARKVKQLGEEAPG